MGCAVEPVGKEALGPAFGLQPLSSNMRTIAHTAAWSEVRV